MDKDETEISPSIARFSVLGQTSLLRSCEGSEIRALPRDWLCPAECPDHKRDLTRKLLLM